MYSAGPNHDSCYRTDKIHWQTLIHRNRKMFLKFHNIQLSPSNQNCIINNKNVQSIESPAIKKKLYSSVNQNCPFSFSFFFSCFWVRLPNDSCFIRYWPIPVLWEWVVLTLTKKKLGKDETGKHKYCYQWQKCIKKTLF